MSEHASADQHVAIAREKLRRFLILADEIISLRQQIQQKLDQQGTGFKDTLRNRALIGLSLKALDSFDRLLLDAREERAECSHHLKTMAECFIYGGWVSGDAEETRAKLLCGDMFRSKAAYYELNGQEQLAAEWRELKTQEVKGLETEWKQFRESGLEQIAEQGDRMEQYKQVYRLACEAAHPGDLFVYMPPQPVEPGLGLADQSLLRAYVCLKFGIVLACDLLHDASDALAIGLGDRIEEFRSRTNAIIALNSRTRQT
jgi:hypothetical protein